jgi:hypothetical protein
MGLCESGSSKECGAFMSNPNTLSLAERFQIRLNALERDSRTAARFTYIGEAIRFSAAQRPDLIAKLDQFASFWNPVLGALQTGAIVALGRIYDQRRDVLSARRLLDCASANQGLFSRASLQARKAAELGLAGAHAYVAADTCVPTQAHFDAIDATLLEHTALYEARIQPIRHKAFAHAGHISPEEMEAMFAAVPRTGLERLTVFPLRLHEALWQAYHNGRELLLGEAPIAIQDLVANPVGRRETSWEHRHAVRDATDFLAWLESAKGD